MASPEASTTSKWTTESPARSSNPAISAFSMGGNIAAGITAFKQIDQLEKDVAAARDYYTINTQDFNFWDRGIHAEALTISDEASTNGLLLPYDQQPLAPAGAFQGYRKYLGDALAEAKSRPYYSRETFQPQYGALDYIASTGRAQSKSSFHLDREWLNTRRKIGRYNVGHGRRIDYKYSIAKLNSELEGWNLGFRFEDHRKMLYDEQRHAHQVEILNIGIGVGNIARAGLASSVKALSEARSQKAGIFGSLSNGLATMAGREQFTQDIKGARERRDVIDYNKGREGAGSNMDVSKSDMNRAERTV